MSKLTKKQYQALVTIREDIKRAYDYIQSKEVVGIAHQVSSQNALGCDYKIINPKCLETSTLTAEYIGCMNKSIGSHIAGLEFALSGITSFLENNQS